MVNSVTHLTTFEVSNIFWDSSVIPELGSSLQLNQYGSAPLVQIIDTNGTNFPVQFIPRKETVKFLKGSFF